MSHESETQPPKKYSVCVLDSLLRREVRCLSTVFSFMRWLLLGCRPGYVYGQGLLGYSKDPSVGSTASCELWRAENVYYSSGYPLENLSTSPFL